MSAALRRGLGGNVSPQGGVGGTAGVQHPKPDTARCARGTRTLTTTSPASRHRTVCRRMGAKTVSGRPVVIGAPDVTSAGPDRPWRLTPSGLPAQTCLLYTSDAADEEDSVDL